MNGNCDKEWLMPLIAQSLTCVRSLTYGDIGFGDDELN